MVQLQIVTCSLLFLLIYVPNASGDALPTRIPLYHCQRNSDPQTKPPPPGPKPHVFAYIEDRAFKNIVKQIRRQPQKYSNYEITKDQVPFPIGGSPQEVLHVTNQDRISNNGVTSRRPFIPTQIPSPLASSEYNDAPSDNREPSDKVCKPNKDSILVQIPINKYFDCKNTEILIKIGKKEAAPTNPPPKKQSEEARPPIVPPYRDTRANDAQQADELNWKRTRIGGESALQRMYLAPRPVRPASYLNTEIAMQRPRIDELPIGYRREPPSQSQLPNPDEYPPQYVVLPVPQEAIEADYSNQPTIPTREDQIKSIVFPEDARQQNAPEDTAPLGYALDQTSILDANKQEQADLDCQHGNNNIPIKDIDVAEFESFAQQQQQQQQQEQQQNEKKIEKREKSSPTTPELGAVKNTNASIETKKSNSRHKAKCSRKEDGKQYGLILGSAEP